MRITILCIVLLSVAAAGARQAHALSTPNVPPSSPYYRDVEKLIGLGYIKPTIVGQRPWARSEFARLTAQAIELQKSKTDIAADSYRAYSRRLMRRRHADGIIARLAREFHEELVEMGLVSGDRFTFRIHPLKELHGSVIAARSPLTTIPYNNGVGTVSADVNPFIHYNEGRHYVDGLQGAFETVHSFGLTQHFSVYVRPRFEAGVDRRSGDAGAKALVQNAYAVFEAKNFSFEFGRDSIVWGFGQYGGAMLTDNARPLDSIRITNPHPARLPWVFRHLGEWRYTLFGANLGPEYARKYGWLAGWAVSLMPSRWVELYVGHTVMMGGEGTPSLSALDVVGEFLGFRPSGSDADSVNKANQMFEGGVLVRIPPLANMQIYASLANEDKRDSIERFLTDGSSYLAGIYLPAIGSSGRADFRVEYTSTCALCYRHSLFSDGWTINRRLLGTDLGPDAEGIHTELGYDISDRSGLSLVVDWDSRRSNLKQNLLDPDVTLGDVVTVEYRPTENRYRGVLSAWWRPTEYARMLASLGYERVNNYQYVAGDARNNFLASLMVSIDLDRFFSYSAD